MSLYAAFSHQIESDAAQARRKRRQAARAAGGNTEMTFSIPAAPILIPKGPWTEIDGCVCAPKGFRAQGGCSQVQLAK